jgi:hypothetical protein
MLAAVDISMLKVWLIESLAELPGTPVHQRDRAAVPDTVEDLCGEGLVAANRTLPGIAEHLDRDALTRSLFKSVHFRPVVYATVDVGAPIDGCRVRSSRSWLCDTDCARDEQGSSKRGGHGGGATCSQPLSPGTSITISKPHE